jgi:hypothetical protein
MFRSKTCPFCNSLIASKVIIHKLRGEHFFEQKLRFGLVLGRMAMQNKNKIWEDYEQLLRAFFNVFRGKKKNYMFAARPMYNDFDCEFQVEPRQ